MWTFCPTFFEEIPSTYARILERKKNRCKLTHFEVNPCVLRKKIEDK